MIVNPCMNIIHVEPLRRHEVPVRGRRRARARPGRRQSLAMGTDKWEVLPGIRLVGTTSWRGLSNHQAAPAQMHLVGKQIVVCRPLLGALRLSLNGGTLAVWPADIALRLHHCLSSSLSEDPRTVPQPVPDSTTGKYPLGKQPKRHASRGHCISEHGMQRSAPSPSVSRRPCNVSCARFLDWSAERVHSLHATAVWTGRLTRSRPGSHV